MARIFIKDAYGLGLLYTYLYSNGVQKMAKLEDLENFHKTVESNLKEIEKASYEVHVPTFQDVDVPIYFISGDKAGEIYYILKPDFDLKKAKAWYIGCLSSEIIKASQMDNSLECLGLMKNGKNIEAMNKPKTKTIKH